MRQKMLKAGSVPASHTQTHTDFQRFAIFVMMLFMLMLKPDVGWGQCAICPELLINERLEINQGTTNGFNAYASPNSNISGWRCLKDSPDFIAIDVTNACVFDSNNPTLDLYNNYFTHIRGYSNPNEGFMQYLSTPIVSDPLISYCLKFEGSKLPCQTNDPLFVPYINNNGKIKVRLSNSLPTPWACYDANITQFFNNSPEILEANITSNTFTEFNTTFSHSKLNGVNYSQIWVYAESESDFISINAIRNLSLKCESFALNGITIDNYYCQNYKFEPNEVRPFNKYVWSIQNNIISDNKIFDYTFTQGGTYNVCLTAFDNNGCCSKKCVDVIVNIEIPNADFSAIGSCPTYTFTPTKPDPDATYSWDFGDGTSSTDQIAEHTFTANGTYTVTLRVTKCGISVVSTQTVVVDCICPIPVANFTYVVNCSGNTNSVNFTSISTGQGLTYLWDFGDGSTFNGQSPPPHQYTNNGSYTVSLTVRDECGQITFVVKKVNVLCSGIGMIECGRKIYENAYLLDASNGDLNFAQYAVQNNVPYTVSLHWGFTNLTFVVRGNVIMDRNLSFNNCTFVFDAGASLTLNNTSKSQSIHFLFSKLYACGDVMWKGVKSLNGSHYFTSGTEIRDAEYGIEVLNGGALTTLNTTFSQNGVGIMFRSNASHRIEGCTFIGDRDKPLLSMYSGQENYKGKSYAGVFFDEIASGNVGRENSTNKNIFRYLMVPIVAFNTNINIHNNEMYEMFVANCDPNIRDKWNACSDIWIFSGAKHKISENIIKTPHRIGILVTDMLDGTMDVTKNKAEELGTFFKSQYNSQNTFNIYNNNESSFQNGGIACYFGIEQGAYGSGENIFNIYNNKFNSNTINPNTYSSIHIYNEGNDLTSSVYYNVFDITKIQFNPAQPTTFSPIVFLADFNFVNFYENTFNSYATNKHYQVHLQLVKKIFASDNKLNNLSPDPSNVQNGFRVFGGNIDSKFYCNQITSANIGSYFYGDFPIIDFSSNLMKNNDIGINVFRLFQGQTNKGNLWVGSNSLANHENGGSFRWSVNPNQPPPAIEPNGMFRPTTVNPPFWFLSVPEFANHCFGPELMGNEETPEAKANLIINSLADENVDGALQRWELQKQLLELFLDFPHLLNANDIYAEALAQIPSDVYLYHNALNEYYEILQLNSEEHTALNNVRNLLNNKVIDKEELWTIIENNAEGNEDDFHSAYQLATELDLLKEQELQILSDIKQRQMNEMYQFNSEVNNLPETQYFHKEMKDMLSIKSELFYYGLEYIKTNHLEYLRNIASKCFIEYGKPVSDAIEILRLNDEQHNMNLDNCTMVENRSKNLKAESEENLIYPNPASSRIYVSQSFSSISHLLIESLEGSLSKMCEYKDDGVDVANLPAGVYLVHLMDNGSMIKTTKFIKIN